MCATSKKYCIYWKIINCKYTHGCMNVSVSVSGPIVLSSVVSMCSYGIILEPGEFSYRYKTFFVFPQSLPALSLSLPSVTKFTHTSHFSCLLLWLKLIFNIMRLRGLFLRIFALVFTNDFSEQCVGFRRVCIPDEPLL